MKQMTRNAQLIASFMQGMIDDGVLLADETSLVKDTVKKIKNGLPVGDTVKSLSDKCGPGVMRTVLHSLMRRYKITI
jgi:hypothetical protein